MENKENCKLVKDLFPSYIDKLTSEETKKYIETHLEECNECKETLKNMKKDFEKENDNIQTIVNYAKKYNRKLKTFKGAFILILSILLIIFIASISRNIIIIKSLSKKTNEYFNCENFHTTWSNYNNKEINITDTFYKDGKYLEKHYFFNLKEEYYTEDNVKSNLIYMVYYDGIEKQTFYFIEDKRIAYQNTKNDNSIKYPSGTPKYTWNVSAYDENLFTLFQTAFLYKITPDKCNNIDAYKFTYRFSNNDCLMCDYFDKNTGLMIRYDGTIIKGGIYLDDFSDIIYEFGTVTDEDIAMPSIEGYTIQNNISN